MQKARDVVLVTGGAGFIGSHLVERLVREGYEVRVVDDFSSGRKQNIGSVASEISVFDGSVLDTGLLRRAAEGCSCIFHLAAVVSVPRSIEQPELVHEVNATGTLSVIEAAKETGARVVFSSSAAVYGEIPCAAQCEEEPPVPISPYGIQKYLGELYLRSYHRVHGLESFALRYFNVYGTRQDPRSPYSGVISIFSERARRGEDLLIFGNGSQTRDYVHVADVVEANLAAMAAPNADGTGLNIGTGKPTNLNDLAVSIQRMHGARGSIRHGEPRNGDILHSCAKTDLALRRIGFKARVGLSVGLESLVEAVHG